MGGYLATWAIQGGAERRQIDYIMINAKYRNAERTAQSNTHWRANTNQNKQHRPQKMQLYYSAAKKYKTPTPTDTEKTLRYDIRELRLRPAKPTNWHQDQDQETVETKAQQGKAQQQKSDNTAQEWMRCQGQLGKSTHQLYPLSKKQTCPEEPGLVTKLEEWGEEKENTN